MFSSCPGLYRDAAACGPTAPRPFIRFCAGVLLLSVLHEVSWGAGFGTTQTIAAISEQASGLVFVTAQNGSWGNPDTCTKQ
jgi:hypothetical protein